MNLYMNILTTKNCKLRTNKGFSMIELVVSTGILIIITTVVLVNHSAFGGNVLLGALAYDVGLSVRQAQVFGLSVREFNVGSGTFDIGYGVHFDVNDSTSYRIFADIDKSKTFNQGDGTEEVFFIGQGFSIVRTCVTSPSNVEICSDVGNVSVLDITFIRPDPDAFIRINGDAVTLYQSARMVIQSPRGNEREVTVESTGQISISQTQI